MNQLLPDSQYEALLGKMIGEGGSREVYEAIDREDVVIKKTKMLFPGTNIIEWLVWNALVTMADDVHSLHNETNADLKNQFAKCYQISESGRFLIMERLMPLGPEDKVDRQKFPSWLNDTKRSAFGKNGNIIKVMDYAAINFYAVLNPKNGPRNSTPPGF